MNILGGCHCANIRFALAWEPEPTTIPARACTCTFCAKHGGVWTSNPAGSLEITVREPEQVSRYAFGTHTAGFHVCTRCGVVPVVTCEIDGRTYAVVNVNTFEGVDAARIAHAPVTHANESTEDRLARRKRNWIATVITTPRAAGR